MRSATRTDNTHPVTTIDQPRRLEDFFVLLHRQLGISGRGILPCLLLIDFEKRLRNIVVVPGE